MILDTKTLRVNVFQLLLFRVRITWRGLCVEMTTLKAGRGLVTRRRYPWTR